MNKIYLGPWKCISDRCFRELLLPDKTYLIGKNEIILEKPIIYFTTIDWYYDDIFKRVHGTLEELKQKFDILLLTEGWGKAGEVVFLSQEQFDKLKILA